MAHANHVEAGLTTPLRYIGIDAVDSVAVEYAEFGDERLAASIAAAEAHVDALVERLLGEMLHGNAHSDGPPLPTASPRRGA